MRLSHLYKKSCGYSSRWSPEQVGKYLASSRRLKKRRGFTLIEVLVVMAIIATLLAIGVGGIKSMASSKGVSTAAPLAESIFKQARKMAKSTGAPARVVIYSSTTGSNADKRDRYLRMIGVATGRNAAGQPENDPTRVTQWRLVSRPVILPSNTFFNPSLSDNPAAATAVFPGSNVAKACYVYEFNGEGFLVGGVGQFVVSAGKLKPGAAAPTLSADSNAARDAGGFKIWDTGRMARFRSPSQILGTDDVTF